jgi:hypothetical protein
MSVVRLLERFERAHAEVLAFARTCPDGRWSLVTEAEGWPVGVVLTHIADGCDAFHDRLGRLLDGRPIEETGDQLDATNARRAIEVATLPRDETIARLGAGADRMVAALRTLTAEQLGVRNAWPVVGADHVSVEQLVEILLWHTTSHLESCRRGALRPSSITTDPTDIVQ